MSDFKEVPNDVDGASWPSRCSACREQFELWYRSLSTMVLTEDEISDILRWDEGRQWYSDNAINLAWKAWHAAFELGDKCRDGCKIDRAVKEFNDSVTDNF